jgi:hypothetical protein
MSTTQAERAIIAFTEDRSAERLLAMEMALLSGEFLIPIGDEEVESRGDRHRVPVVCFRTEEGFAAAPAFTSVERLFDWKPEGSRYVSLRGYKLIDMVFAMPEVDVIAVNPKGVPRGLIPREDFLRLLSLHHGVAVTADEGGVSARRRKPMAVAMAVLLALVVAFSIAVIATRG